MPRLGATFIVLTLMASCATAPRVETELDWLGGCWISADRLALERWSPVQRTPTGWRRDGHGLRLRTDGTVAFAEALRLDKAGGDVTYWAKPSNAADWTAFPLVEATEASATFANPEHDNPKSLRYARHGEALRAWTGDGKTERLVFDGRPDGCD